MRLLRKPKTLFARMLLSFIVVLVALILVLTSILYVNFERIGLRMVTEANAKVLSQISYSASYMHENARNFAFSVFADADATEMMYQDKEDVTRTYMKMSRFRQFVQLNASVQSVYLYNRRLNKFYSTWGSIDNESDAFFDRDMIEAMKQAAARQDRFKPIPRKINLNLSSPDKSPQYTNVFTYVLYELPSAGAGVEGAVVVNIKGEYFKSIIATLDQKHSLSGGVTYIVDQSGTVVHSTDESLYLRNLSAVPYIHHVLDATDAAGSFLQTENGSKRMVTYVSSEPLGWKFVHVVPYGEVIAPINKVKWTSLAVCAILLAAGLIISYFVSKRLYFPIGALVGNVSRMRRSADSHGDEAEADEVALLSRAFMESQRKANSLDLAERNVMLLRRNEMLRHLLSDEHYSNEQIAALFTRYSIALQIGQPYVLVAMRIDGFADFAARYSLKDQVLLKYAVGNAANELIGDSFDNEIVDFKDDLLIAMVGTNGRAAGEVYETLTTVIRRLQNWTSQQMKLSFSAAIGRMNGDLSAVHLACREVQDAVRYRLVFGYGAVIRAEQVLVQQQEERYKIPAELETKLQEALVAGRTEEADAVYAAIVEQLKRHSYDTIMAAFLYLTYFVYNSVNTMEGNSLHQFNIDFNTFIQQINACGTIVEIDRRFSALFAHIGGVIQESKQKRNTVFTETVVDLIHRQYRDPSLCLDSIANSLHFSKAYVGKLFREACGQSVADYITEYRMKMAVELIDKGGNKRLDDILQAIGFENKNYFYKVFKQRMGISFSDYKLKSLKRSPVADER